MRIVDLTIEQFEGNLGHPGHGRAPVFLRGTVSHGTTYQRGIKSAYDGEAVSVANEYLILTGHTGTHVDAPSHIDYRSAKSIETIPLERTCGPAIWLDVSSNAGPGSRFTPEMLAEAERRAGSRIRPGDIVLIHTGWLEQARGDRTRYVDESPGLTREAAEWLRARRIKALGVDLVGPDLRDASDLPVHVNFLRPRAVSASDDDYILIFENVANIRTIGRPRFTFFGLPLPLRGATGSPVRAIALVDEDGQTSYFPRIKS